MVGRAGAADPPLPDLDHPADVAHLRGATHVARQAEPLPADLVAPVDVGVQLEDRERHAGIRLEDGDRGRVVATQDDGHGPGGQDGPDRSADELPVAGRVVRPGGQVADVDDPPVAVAEDRSAEIEVHVPERASVTGDGGPDGPRRVRGIRPGDGVGRGMGHAEDHHVGLEGVEDAGGQTHEGRRGGAAEDAADVGHDRMISGAPSAAVQASLTAAYQTRSATSVMSSPIRANRR